MNNTEVVGKLLEKKLSISCAESMTGGMFAKYITDVPGTSAIFDRGIVTYSNEAKADELKVKQKTLDAYGAISPECAEEMVAGLYKKTGCDVCIAVTGNAGPDPAEGKKVGTYYVGLSVSGDIKVLELHSKKKKRATIREDACEKMFSLIEDAIDNKA